MNGAEKKKQIRRKQKTDSKILAFGPMRKNVQLYEAVILNCVWKYEVVRMGQIRF